MSFVLRAEGAEQPKNEEKKTTGGRRFADRPRLLAKGRWSLGAKETGPAGQFSR
jgi:hypothetical protein